MFLIRPNFKRVFANEGEFGDFLYFRFRFFAECGCRSSKSSHTKSVGKFSKGAKKVLPSFSGSRSFLFRGLFLGAGSGCCCLPFGEFGCVFCSMEGSL